MVTTRRSNGGNSSVLEHGQGGIALLEREIPRDYNEFTNGTQVQEEDFEQAREKMHKNLAALLNYDKVEEKVEEKVEIPTSSMDVENKVKQVSQIVSEADDEDIRPTLTTMQFGDADLDQMRAEMKTEEVAKEKYQLSGKGKIAVVLYALVVTVILALIVLNTGVLARMNTAYADKSVILDNKIEQYASLQTNIEQVSSNEHVINTAINEYGMFVR